MHDEQFVIDMALFRRTFPKKNALELIVLGFDIWDVPEYLITLSRLFLQ